MHWKGISSASMFRQIISCISASPFSVMESNCLSLLCACVGMFLCGCLFCACVCVYISVCFVSMHVHLPCACYACFRPVHRRKRPKVKKPSSKSLWVCHDPSSPVCLFYWLLSYWQYSTHLPALYHYLSHSSQSVNQCRSDIVLLCCLVIVTCYVSSQF